MIRRTKEQNKKLAEEITRLHEVEKLSFKEIAKSPVIKNLLPEVNEKSDSNLRKIYKKYKPDNDSEKNVIKALTEEYKNNGVFEDEIHGIEIVKRYLICDEDPVSYFNTLLVAVEIESGLDGDKRELAIATKIRDKLRMVEP